MDHRSAWILLIRSFRRHQPEGGKDTLTSSAETKYAIVCPSAMRVIQFVSNAACTHDWVQTELPANRSLSAARMRELSLDDTQYAATLSNVGGKACRTLGRQPQEVEIGSIFPA